MKKKLLLGISIFALLLTITGCKSAVKKAYDAYDKKTSPTVEEITDKNYKEVLKDRFGIDTEVLEKDGFELLEVYGGDNETDETINLYYKHPYIPEVEASKLYKNLYEATKEAGNGTLYKENDAGFITEEELDDEDYMQDRKWFYLFEGRTYSVYNYLESEEDCRLNITLRLEIEDRLENVRNYTFITEDNYAEIMKEDYGIDPILYDEWKFDYVSLSDNYEDFYAVAFDAGDSCFNDDDSYSDDIVMELISKYFEATKKVSNGQVFAGKPGDDGTEIGDKVTDFEEIHPLYDDEETYSWFYYWNDHKIFISLEPGWCGVLLDMFLEETD
jgi:hypothetical protein